MTPSEIAAATLRAWRFATVIPPRGDIDCVSKSTARRVASVGAAWSGERARSWGASAMDVVGFVFVFAFVFVSGAVGCASRQSPEKRADVVDMHVGAVDGAAPLVVADAGEESSAGASGSPCMSLARIGAAGDDAPAKLFVTSAGVICFERTRAVDMAALEAQAKAFAQAHGIRRVVIYADGSTPYARVVEMMDALRRGGLDEVTFAVQAGADR